MRFLVVLVFFLSLTTQVDSAQKQANPDNKKVEKPAQRTVSARSGIFQIKIQMTPGVPDPRQMESVTIDVAEIPAVPDPIYGESIPAKNVHMVAQVIQEDGAGLATPYRVHPLTDAGSYGFHFTPLRRDVYLLRIKGTHKERTLDTKVRIGAGIWPLTKVDSEDQQQIVPSKTSKSRLPAIPESMRSTGFGQHKSGLAGSKINATTTLADRMQEIGSAWVDLQIALFGSLLPDLKKAQNASQHLFERARDALDHRPAPPDFAVLMQEMIDEGTLFRKSAASKQTKKIVQSYHTLGARHCNRCHFVHRFKLINKALDYPQAL